VPHVLYSDCVLVTVESVLYEVVKCCALEVLEDMLCLLEMLHVCLRRGGNAKIFDSSGINLDAVLEAGSP